MTTHTTTLADFLLARIAEDEARARAAQLRVNWLRMCDWIAERSNAGVGLFVLDHDPARVLAECEAKRAIVGLSWHHLGDEDYGWGMEEAKRQILVLMARVYSDHPDYREEWRP